jgi:hypothetical protein
MAGTELARIEFDDRDSQYSSVTYNIFRTSKHAATV